MVTKPYEAPEIRSLSVEQLLAVLGPPMAGYGQDKPKREKDVIWT